MSKIMSASLTAAVLGAAVLSVSGPTFAAASQEARRDCERKADQASPMLSAPEREAFIANCLADATATPKKKSGSNY